MITIDTEIQQKNLIYELLREVIDPELLINIVDLGLIYKIEYSGKTRTIIVSNTLTSPGCPMGDMIVLNIEEVLKNSFPDHTIIVQLVWSPKWTPDMVSEEGKLSLTIA